jgi:hypothetical protein
MKQQSLVLLTVAVLSIAALACSALGGAGKVPEAVSTAQAVATEVKSAESGTPAPKAPAVKPTATTSASGGGDTLSLQSRDAGLDKLKSYKMRWLAEWKSTDTGSTESDGWDWVEEYSSDPAALHWNWNITNSTDKTKNTQMEAWQVGNTMYMQTVEADGTKQCISMSSDDKSNQLSKGLFNPSMLGSVSDAQYVGTDTVNGIKAKHYKYNEKSANLFGAAKVSGEIWVAVDGGFVVKETVNWSGAAGLFGAGSKSKGDGKWSWELSNVNQPITITPPENCGGAAADIPVMKDATDKTSVGDTIMYKTASSVADVVEFYKQQMPAKGWSLEGEPEVTEESATMQFTQGDQTAQVMLSVDQGKTQVVINVTR